MAAQPAPQPLARNLQLIRLATFDGLRVLAWDRVWLYAARGYELLRAAAGGGDYAWQSVGRYDPPRWRKFTVAAKLTARLVRDSFHALAVLPDGHLIGALPGAIVTLIPGETRFQVTHRLLRGTRPLHFCVTPQARIFWGEYFDNPQRDEVHIYGSDDQGTSWQIAYTFRKGAIRHVHNIVHDPWGDCLWILTGDQGSECRILRASLDLRSVETVLSGSQQTRTAALVPTPQALYFSTDTPLEHNHVFCMDRSGSVKVVADLLSSSIYGCRANETVLFSTMVEPSSVNRSQLVSLVASRDGVTWSTVQQWKKDRWPMGLFQYGNIFLPDGPNTSNVLAATSIAVEGADQHTSLWQIEVL